MADKEIYSAEVIEKLSRLNLPVGVAFEDPISDSGTSITATPNPQMGCKHCYFGVTKVSKYRRTPEGGYYYTKCGITEHYPYSNIPCVGGRRIDGLTVTYKKCRRDNFIE